MYCRQTRSYLRTPQISGLSLLLFVLLRASSFAAPAYSVFVTNSQSQDIREIDPDANTVVRTIPTDLSPREISVGQSTGHLYIALRHPTDASAAPTPPPADQTGEGIGVFDPANGQQLSLLGPGSAPRRFSLDLSESRIAIARGDRAAVGIWTVSTGKNSDLFPLSETPEVLALHPRRSLVYVTDATHGELKVLNSLNGRQLDRVAIGGRPRSIAFLPDGSRAFIAAEGTAVVSVIETVDHRVLRKIPLPAKNAVPLDTLVSPDGSTLFVASGPGDSVIMIDIALAKTVATIPTRGYPRDLALSPDGTTLYCANTDSNDVSVIDVAKRSEIRRIEVGAKPWGIAILAKP